MVKAVRSSANDNPFWSKRAQQDLERITRKLLVGDASLAQRKISGSTLNVTYQLDGRFWYRRFRSHRSWMTIVSGAISDGLNLVVHEMDTVGRYHEMFPSSLYGRSRPLDADDVFARSLTLYRAVNGEAVVLVLQSILDGHAVDAIHNLSASGPQRQLLWISDLMALRPMRGIRLVRDKTFTARALLNLCSTTDFHIF